MNEAKIVNNNQSEVTNNDSKNEQEQKSGNIDFKKNPSDFLMSYMTNSNNNNDIVVENKQESSMTPTEKEAYRQGWRPREIYDGNPDNWIPASQYLKNGSFMSQNKALNDQIRQLTTEVKQLRDLSRTQASIFAQEKAEEAKRKRMEAFESKNLEEMDKYQIEYQKYNQDAINYSKEIPIDPQSKPENQQPIPIEVMQFKSRNSNWFNNNTPMNVAMTTFATQTDDMLREQHPEWSLERRLGEVEQEVKRGFANVFSNPARNGHLDVEPKTANTSYTSDENKLPRFDELPKELQYLIDQSVELSKGKITRENYIKQLKNSGSI